MGIRAQLIDRTEADLRGIRGELARLSDGDLTRGGLEESEAELVLLLDDLEHRLPSPRVLEATGHIRARGVE
jgi:hypothetical protein